MAVKLTFVAVNVTPDSVLHLAFTVYVPAERVVSVRAYKQIPALSPMASKYLCITS
jgi:hypothetical protein